MSETVESATNGGENGNPESENTTEEPKVNGMKDVLPDSEAPGTEEPEEDEEESKDNEEKDDGDKRPRRSTAKPAEVSVKKTPKKAAPRGRKSTGPSGGADGESAALKNKLPPYKEIAVELCTKTIVIGKGTDFKCIPRAELTAIPNKEGKFGVGDLIWAKMTGYPWWPCMIAIDPQTGKHSRISGKFFVFFISGFVAKIHLFFQTNRCFLQSRSCLSCSIFWR